MKIDLGGGAYLEPDLGPTKYHRRIVSATPIPGTRSGNLLKLECGHQPRAYGNLEHAGGYVFCNQCRDAEGKDAE